MKVRQILINQFGHFSDCSLAFPNDGLQVIYGPNEAGKTTLLQFLRGWLFDFPPQTPYDFKAGAKIAGVGTLILSDGRTVELRRRKGIKDKVRVKIDGQETGLDEVGFQRLIGHADRSLFESVFAFGLDQLSRGEVSLKHESLQSALFGGGLGSAASPERILQELERQALELFSPAGKKPAINSLLTELKSLSAQIKASSLRSDDYLKRRREVEVAVARAAELHHSVNQLRHEHARLGKLCRAWPKWTELQQCLLDRAPLTVPASLPLDARAKYANLSGKIQDYEDESGQLANSIASREREMASWKLDPHAVSFQAEVRDCLELKRLFLGAKQDLPIRKVEYASAREQIDRELNKLRPGWTHDDLRSFSVDVATRAEIDRLIEQDRQDKNTQVGLRAKRDQLSAQLRQCRADLESLGEPRDIAAIEAVLSDESTYSADRKVWENRSKEAAKIERQVAKQLKKLTPPLPAGDPAPHELPVLRIDTIRQFEADFAELREQLRGTLKSLQQNETELREVGDKLDELTSRGVVPSLGERDAARQYRDASWLAIRNRLIEGHDDSASSRTDALSLGDAFEQAIRDADAIADRIYSNADAVFRREELGRQLNLLGERIKQERESVREQRQQQSELQERWVAAWNSCGFVPLEPDAMRAWLTDHEVACDLVAKHEDAVAESERLRQSSSAFEQRLRDTCESASGDIPMLLVTAHGAVEDAKECIRRSRELKRDIKRIEPQLHECDADLQMLCGREGAWREAWNSVLGRLRLPADLDTELTRTVIGGLISTRGKLDNLPQEEGRMALMQSCLDEFVAKVRPLCEALAPELVRDPPELAVVKLSEQLDRAAEAQKQFDQSCKQRDVARDQQKLINSRHAKLVSDRTDLFAAAQANSEAEFFAIVASAEKIGRLDAELEQRTHEIDLIRAGEEREEFERLLTELDSHISDGERRDLADRLQSAEGEMSKADGAKAVAKSELEKLDGSGEAAILMDQLSRQRSHLAAEVDRYVPLVFARHLLSEAVRRFERENQPEMIDMVSRLIDQMTAGRYTKFDRTTGSSQGILVRRFDGIERTPDQLSSGTREQLYLAIRLAYVLHYCRQNEPLPIVMDDVLVNFDDDRVRNTLTTLADVAKSVQILFFTCHPHMVALAKEMVPGLQPIDLPSAISNGPAAVSA